MIKEQLEKEGVPSVVDEHLEAKKGWLACGVCLECLWGQAIKRS